ncbi:MAG: hypothetical protein H6685_10990 [Deltaproteobacteria bacterium]|nr:hypothetical protein [Deltaproteobacteria bacterium]
MRPTFSDILRTLAALPFLLFFWVLAKNEYFFVPIVAQVGAAAVIVAGIVLRVVLKRRVHTPFWLVVFLAVYNFPMSVGGYVFLGGKMFLVGPAAFALGLLLFAKTDRPRRLGAGAFAVMLVGILVMHYQRNLDFDEKFQRCEKDAAAVDEPIKPVDDFRHPYDFAVVPVRREVLATSGDFSQAVGPIVAATYGMSSRVRWFDGGTDELLRTTPVDNHGEVQRLVADPKQYFIYAPPWGRRGEDEELLRLNIKTGDVQSIDVHGSCRNLFDVAIDRTREKMFGVCEVSHSLVAWHWPSMRPAGEAPLPGRDAYDLAIDEARGRVLTTDYWSPDLTVVDAETLEMAARVRVGWSTFGVVAAADRYFVARPLASEVVVVNADTLEIERRIDVGYGVRDIEYDAGRGVLFAGNYFDGTVDAVDPATGQRLGRLFAGRLLRGLLYEPTRDRLFIAAGCGVRVLDLADWTAVSGGSAPVQADSTKSPVNSR